MENKPRSQILIGTLWFFDGESWNRDPISDKLGPNRLSDWPISLDQSFTVHKTEKLGLLPEKGWPVMTDKIGSCTNLMR